MKNKEGIDFWRKKIDDINLDILALMHKRVDAAKRIGEIKKSRGLAISDASREKAIIDHLVKQNKGPLDNKGLRSIFRTIIRETKRIEHGV